MYSALKLCRVILRFIRTINNGSSSSSSNNNNNNNHHHHHHHHHHIILTDVPFVVYVNADNFLSVKVEGHFPEAVTTIRVIRPVTSSSLYLLFSKHEPFACFEGSCLCTRILCQYEISACFNPIGYFQISLGIKKLKRTSLPSSACMARTSGVWGNEDLL